MAKLKASDIQNGFTKKGEPMKYFIYEREKTHGPIEVALNKNIETDISYLRENFKCTDDYLLPIVTTRENGKALYNHITEKRKKFNKYFKKMAKIMEFPEGLADLSTYFARHSFGYDLVQ